MEMFFNLFLNLYDYYEWEQTNMYCDNAAK